MELYRRTYADINLDSLAHNWKYIQTLAKMNSEKFQERFICPMVKANAYGHGDIQVAKHLEDWGARSLGVCLIEEGLLLKKAGVKA